MLTVAENVNPQAVDDVQQQLVRATTSQRSIVMLHFIR